MVFVILDAPPDISSALILCKPKVVTVFICTKVILGDFGEAGLLFGLLGAPNNEKSTPTLLST